MTVRVNFNEVMGFEIVERLQEILPVPLPIFSSPTSQERSETGLKKINDLYS
jgi:hypothetical protein